MRANLLSDKLLDVILKLIQKFSTKIDFLKQQI